MQYRVCGQLYVEDEQRRYLLPWRQRGALNSHHGCLRQLYVARDVVDLEVEGIDVAAKQPVQAQ